MRYLRRARRRTLVGGVLPLGRLKLCILLAVPRAHRTSGGSTRSTEGEVGRHLFISTIPAAARRPRGFFVSAPTSPAPAGCTIAHACFGPTLPTPHSTRFTEHARRRAFRRHIGLVPGSGSEQCGFRHPPPPREGSEQEKKPQTGTNSHRIKNQHIDTNLSFPLPFLSGRRQG